MADALAALLIATLFATGLLGANGITVNAASKAHDRLLAACVARAILIRPAGETSGMIKVDGTEFTWRRAQAERTMDASHAAQLEDIEVRVSWAGTHETQTLTFNTTKVRGRDG